jgi:transcription elongation factor Elf1
MANEENYRVEILHNPNAVPECFACPVCHNDDMDTLEIHEDDTVTCLDCGNVYKV